jgi:hypothetical protein
MLRCAAVSLFALGFLLLETPFAHACKCAEPPAPNDAATSAAAVFEGRVTKLTPSGMDLVVELNVVRSWKGVTAEHILVRTRSESAACGFPFAIDESYLVYADASPEQPNLPSLSVLHCGRTRLMVDADADVTELGMGSVPVSPTPSELAQESKPAAPPSPPTNDGVLGTQQNKPAAGGCASCQIASASGSPSRGACVFAGVLACLLRSRRRSHN